MKRSLGFQIFLGIVCAAVIAIVGLGLYYSGSPVTERIRNLDQQRTQRLDSLSYTIDQYYQQERQLPNSLKDLSSAPIYIDNTNTIDPETGASFDYLPTATSTYQLCANFGQDSSIDNDNQPQPYGPNPNFWIHGVGHTCFTVKVRGADLVPPPKL
jgi:hypothetical protein